MVTTNLESPVSRECEGAAEVPRPSGLRRPETAEEAGRALGDVPWHELRAWSYVVIAMTALVLLCLALGAVVWWRLLY